MEKKTYLTRDGIEITRKIEYTKENAIPEIVKQLDVKKGAIYSSNYEYPGRYSRWEIGFLDPGIEFRNFKDYFLVQALSEHGKILYACIRDKIRKMDYVEIYEEEENYIKGKIKFVTEIFSEEKRSKQNSIFSVLRQITSMFYSTEDEILGLYGAFGYDLIFQFEKDIELIKDRDPQQENLVLYLPDSLFVYDKKKEEKYYIEYDFKVGNNSTFAANRVPFTNALCFQPVKHISKEGSKKGDYATMVKKALESFRKGDLFEVVPSHVLNKSTDLPAHTIYNNMVLVNPSPYNFFINLGQESLIGSSPEMYVRVDGNKVETCPISGTIKRGCDALEDAENIRTLLNSSKDEAELTMCTDVDRNDKSRVCIPGSVQVVGRRQIEKYSHLIHTVDHIQGTLAEGYDLFDAFLTHMWAVTVTGAPKKAAVEWIETNETTPRDWYGGAIGYIKFNGDMNTGLTLRTVRVCGKNAQIRVGATLLIDSDPDDEEAETMTKAAALVESISYLHNKEERSITIKGKRCLVGKKVLIVDHEDSFVHTLANYISQMGATVTVIRYNHFSTFIDKSKFDVVMLSPGPGTPAQFNLSETIRMCEERGIPILGICLGLQGIVEYYGGELSVLNKPRHGVKKTVRFSNVFFKSSNLEKIDVGLYHSIFASKIPNSLNIIAKDDEGIVMGVLHENKPVLGLQFHPESILSKKEEHGVKILIRSFELLGIIG